MDLDKTKYILMCRMKSSDIICIQLIRSNVSKSTVIEKVQTYGSSSREQDAIKRFKWLSRMSMYIEGTARGRIKVRDILKAGELIMHVPTDFKSDEPVAVLGYNAEKNILFAANKDGQFRLWKVHHEWRDKNIEK